MRRQTSWIRRFFAVRTLGWVWLAGIAMSLFQAWSSLAIYDLGGARPWRPESYIEAINNHWFGQFGEPLSRVKAIGPTDADDMGWWYVHETFLYGIETTMCSNPSVAVDKLSNQLSLYSPIKLVEPPHWSVSSKQPTPRDKALYPIEHEVVAGWPFSALYGSLRIEGMSDKPQFRWAWVYTKIKGENPIIMPCQPLWGFWLNSLFFSVVAWTIIVILSTLKQLILTWRYFRYAVCPSCGYDTRGFATCPECGQNLAADTTVCS